MSTIGTKFLKTAATVGAAIAIVAGAMLPAATSASAGDFRSRGYGHYDGRPAYRVAPPRAYYEEPRRRDRGGQIAKGLAIGIGAAVVGAILADQARRTRGEYYD